jgi:hypothetical protein
MAIVAGGRAMVSPDNIIFINISTCHVLICRYHELPDGSLAIECASNAAELEADAIAAIAGDGKPFTIGGYHPCPPELAARAQWS